jgi:protein-S-isoprenylcysteine O-methyltransferase Ste14
VTHSTTLSLIGYTWGALGLVWLIGLAFTRRTVRRHLALASVGFALLGSNWFAHTWMAMRFLPQSQLFDTVGLALTVAGCAFAVWARITLGRNWSGQATIKSGHEVIVTGPYALARHPIYTGFVTAAIGTAFAVGEIRCVLGLVVIVLALMIKMSQEEKLMMQTFPDVYARYRQHVRALIPGFL